MKIIYLAIHNIYKIIKYNSMIFILIVISMIVSAFGLLFYSGYIAETYYETQLGNGDKINIQLIENPNEYSLKTLLNSLENSKVKISNIQITNFKDIKMIQDSQNYSTGLNSTGDISNIPIVGEYNESFNRKLLIGRCLTINDDEPIAVLPSGIVTCLQNIEEPINSIIDYNNKKLEIVGVVSYTYENAIVVPIEYYIHNFGNKYMRIGFNSSLSKSDRLYIEDILNKYNIISKCEWTFAESALLSSEFWLNFVQIIFIFLLVIINIFGMIYFLMIRMKRSYNVYSICGSQKKQTMAVILIQTYIIMIIGIIIGFLIYMLLLPFFNDLVYKSDINFYFLIFQFIITMILVGSIIMAKLVNKKVSIYKIME